MRDGEVLETVPGLIVTQHYYYTSRLPGEPLAGIDDVHTHPTLRRTARVNVVVGF